MPLSRSDVALRDALTHGLPAASLARLAAVAAHLSGARYAFITISDDGSRVVTAHGMHVDAVPADLLTTFTPLVTDDGRPVGLLIVGETAPLTISDLQRDAMSALAAAIAAEIDHARQVAAAEQQARRFTAIVAASDDAIVGTDERGIITSWSRGAERVFGYASSEIVGSSFLRLIPADRQHEHEAILARLGRGETIDHLETVRQAKDGSARDILVTIVPLADADGRIVGALRVLRDVTALKRVELTEDRYHALFDYSPYGITINDARGAYVEVNDAFCRMTGYAHEALVGMHITDIVTPAQVPRIAVEMHSITPGNDYTEAWRLRRRDGSEFDAEVTATRLPDGNYLGMIRDVTERNRHAEERYLLEQQYQQAQKMDAIGRLAGGIAHDFNNLLTAILGYCELLGSALGKDDPRREDVEEIEKASRRAASLTRQLLAFSRKQIVEPIVLDLNAVVTDMRSMLTRIIGEHIRVSMALESGLWGMRADPGQIEQVLLNLTVNARDAMPQGGALTIATANVVLDAQSHAMLPAGRYVRLTVTDTGLGMSTEVQARVFEPFFTTKAVGQGSGLGLATVHGIVAQSGGAVRVDSEPGHGATFTLHFPAVDGDVALPAPVVVPALRGTGQTVLVVEDAESLRELARRLLQRLGYRVLVAGNAEQAMQIFEPQAERIDVLLTDVVMPGMSGPALARALVARKPALKVLYMTGYTEDAIIVHGLSDSPALLLHKPFTSEALATKLAEVLALDTGTQTDSLDTGRAE